MASTSFHVTNMKIAIDSGDIPGEFTDDFKVFAFPTLLYTSAKNATLQWSISVRLIYKGEFIPITDEMLDQSEELVLTEEYKAEIIVKASQVGGKVRDVIPTYVSKGKNIGKKNATNCITQAIRDAFGLYNKQKKRGSTIGASAEEQPHKCEVSKEKISKNPPPMLVKKNGSSHDATLKAEDFINGITVQRKLNGVRLIIYKSDTDPAYLVRYSRTGIEYPGQLQIVSEMMQMISVFADKDIPYFDGELYVHGKPLNWISGQARKSIDDDSLEYHIFDMFVIHSLDMKSIDRQAYLDAFFANADAAGIAHPHIIRVENFKVKNESEINTLAKQFLDENYEGAIARKDVAEYRYGYNNYHSSNLVKIKPVFEDEFKVVGYTQGTRGKDVGAIIWECENQNPVVMPNNVYIDVPSGTFTVVPKDMTYQERYKLYKCLGEIVLTSDGVKTTLFDRDIKGLPLTVEYREMSISTGKPLQAKALAFRTYESGPLLDPIRTLLEKCVI